ncbi:MAG: hypothetical protein RR559_00035 [Bacteroides sp.]
MDFKIIAIDFDGTLCEDKWPDIGAPNIKLINHIKREQRNGAKLILWTCRTKEPLRKAVAWCHENHDLRFDAINQNVPCQIDRYGEDTRKVYATEYIDDRSLNSYNLPFASYEDVLGQPKTRGYVTNDLKASLNSIYGTGIFNINGGGTKCSK